MYSSRSNSICLCADALNDTYVHEDSLIGPQRNISADKYKSEFSTGHSIDVSNHPNVHLLPNFSVCGINEKWLREDMRTPSRRPKRIVGGLPATSITRYPWMAQIYVRDSKIHKTLLRPYFKYFNSICNQIDHIFFS